MFETRVFHLNIKVFYQFQTSKLKLFGCKTYIITEDKAYENSNATTTASSFAVKKVSSYVFQIGDYDVLPTSSYRWFYLWINLHICINYNEIAGNILERLMEINSKCFCSSTCEIGHIYQKTRNS